MSKILPIGITEGSVMLTDADASFDLDTKFRMIKEAGVFDYIEKTPPPDLEGDYARCSEKYDLPIRAGGWFYSLGRDEGLLEENLKLGGRLGSVVHNTQILAHQADGRPVTNHQVAEIYLRALDWGEQAGCVPTFEVHVNMWSEDFRRISEVADLVEARGVPFRMTLDHSHVIFKIDNPKEQDVFDIRGDVETGVLVLDPFEPANVCAEWISAVSLGMRTHGQRYPTTRSTFGQNTTTERLVAAFNIHSSVRTRANGTAPGAPNAWIRGKWLFAN